MNILLITAARSWGGVKTWMLSLAEFLSQRGHHVAIVCREGDMLAVECAKRHLICYPVRFGMDFSLKTIRTFWQLFESEGTDIIITNISKELRTAGVAAKLKGVVHINCLGAFGDLKMTMKTRLLYFFLVDKCLSLPRVCSIFLPNMTFCARSFKCSIMPLKFPL
jgi:hypothetical protein